MLVSYSMGLGYSLSIRYEVLIQHIQLPETSFARQNSRERLRRKLMHCLVSNYLSDQLKSSTFARPTSTQVRICSFYRNTLQNRNSTFLHVQLMEMEYFM